MEMKIIATMNGKKVQVLEKRAIEIEETPRGKKVILFFKNKEEYHGIFQFMDGSDIVIQSLKSKQLIGLPKNSLVEFLQEK